jgi:hypothetical protein
MATPAREVQPGRNECEHVNLSIRCQVYRLSEVYT